MTWLTTHFPRLKTWAYQHWKGIAAIMAWWCHWPEFEIQFINIFFKSREEIQCQAYSQSFTSSSIYFFFHFFNIFIICLLTFCSSLFPLKPTSLQASCRKNPKDGPNHPMLWKTEGRERSWCEVDPWTSRKVYQRVFFPQKYQHPDSLVRWNVGTHLAVLIILQNVPHPNKRMIWKLLVVHYLAVFSLMAWMLWHRTRCVQVS